jgi:hypothetical protein
MGLALDEPKEEDRVETMNGIVVAIDPIILDYTKEMSLDVQHGSLVMLGNESCC